VSLTIAIIIPTYNERENLRGLVPRILGVLTDYGIDGHIIVVDDSSPDNTGALATELSNKHRRVTAIIREKKLGIGSAYKEGFRTALSRGFDGLIEMDADGSHNPHMIPRLVNKLEEGYALVIGSRYISGGAIPAWSLRRRILSKITGSFTRVLFDLKTHDPTSGFRAYRATPLNNIDLAAVRSDGYAFQVEMVARFEKMGLRVCEIPIEFVDRVKGKSKLGVTAFFRYFTTLLRLFFEL
jgi:dolichol-phosphate mannosyltransferase